MFKRVVLSADLANDALQSSMRMHPQVDLPIATSTAQGRQLRSLGDPRVDHTSKGGHNSCQRSPWLGRRVAPGLDWTQRVYVALKDVFLTSSREARVRLAVSMADVTPGIPGWLAS
jgi:hypothetical protein